jgi:GMP synthase-like glutamine amidotransferase
MSILIIHHVETNNLGPLEEVLQAHKLPYQYLFCHQLGQHHVDLTGVTGLIMLGGPQSAAKEHKYAFMKPEQAMIRNAVSQNLPVFGICLGSQLLAHSLGAPVEKNMVDGHEIKEIGWTPIELSAAGQSDPVLRYLAGMAQFQWHEDTYHLPPNAIHLASTTHCAQQAFKLDRPHNKTYGVQFHPEVSKDVIQDWLYTSNSLNTQRKRAIWEETEIQFAERHAASRRMFKAFCEIAF